MRVPSAAELLDAWERGLDQPPALRPLALLAAAWPEAPPEELARLSVGRRDARLLTLRERTFGPRMAGLVDCPGCGERLELSLDARELRLPGGDEPAAELSLSAAGYEVRFRLPDSLDLAAVADFPDAAAARRLLFERCLLEARCQGEAKRAGQIPEAVAGAVAARMAEADPQADVQLALSCSACGRQTQAAFDIASFFWGEVDAWARRLLREIHTLASAYGWGEAEILALSPRRRQTYLELVGG